MTTPEATSGAARAGCGTGGLAEAGLTVRGGRGWGGSAVVTAGRVTGSATGPVGAPAVLYAGGVVGTDAQAKSPLGEKLPAVGVVGNETVPL